MNILTSTSRKCNRKKVINLTETPKLKRCLRLFDLTALGVGSTLGVGIYILAGQIAKVEAGPAVTISFFIAAFASIFAGLCYAEFGARVPKAGSAYIYSYVSIGEFVAFLIGWSMLLSYMIGASSVAKGFTKNIDFISGGKLTEGLKSLLSIQLKYFDETIDIVSFALIMVLTISLCFGIKESSLLVNFLTALNLLVVIFVFIAGMFYVNIDNWFIDEKTLFSNYSEICGNSTLSSCGNGGFAPFGFPGIMQGAATAFYGFVGFDVISTVGEEVIHPERNIPFSIVLSLLIVFCAYFGIATVITMDLPYFLQDANAPLPHLFDSLQINWAVWIIQIGAFIGLFASLIGVLIPMPRIVWSMSEDGLLFNFLSKINTRFQTPIYATLLSGFIAAVMAALFDLNVLIDLMSIGTLLAYTMVSACILILRYLPSQEEEEELSQRLPLKWMNLIFNTRHSKIPTAQSARIANCCTFLIGLDSIGLCYCANDVNLIGIGVFGGFLLFLLFILLRQPMSTQKLEGFTVPFVPFIPSLSILINVYLMTNLALGTWLQFLTYLFIGLIIYFGYGIRHSKVEV